MRDALSDVIGRELLSYNKVKAWRFDKRAGVTRLAATDFEVSIAG
jgi:hypothetical protein